MRFHVGENVISSFGLVLWRMEEGERPYCEKCVRPVPLLPTTTAINQFDIVIVGGGLAGCWTAYWLSRRAPKSKIAVLDGLPDIMDGHSWRTPSTVNAGCLSATYDGENVTRELVADVAAVKWKSLFGRVSQLLWERKLFGRLSDVRYDDIGIAFPTSVYSLAFLSSLFWHLVSPASRRDPPHFSYSRFFQSVEEQSIKWYRNLSSEMVDTLGVSFLTYSTRYKVALSLTKPSPSPAGSPQWIDAIAKCDLNRDDFSLNSDRFLRMFHTFLMKKNVSFFYNTSVSEVSTSSGQVIGLKTTQGNVVATSMYVFCTGAAFHPIMNRWAYPAWGVCRDYEYQRKRDESAAVPTTTTVEEPHYLYIVPRGKNGLRVTSGFYLGLSPPTDEHLKLFVRSIDTRTKDALTPAVMKNLRLTSSSSVQYGARPVCADGRPVIGPHPDLRNAFVMNGLGMYGHSSPELCRLLCDMMTGRMGEVEKTYGCLPEMFSPTRLTYGDFTIRWMNRLQFLKESVFGK
jgi:glycine/D-amino acid oxidase-like deaminating enzyme